MIWQKFKTYKLHHVTFWALYYLASILGYSSFYEDKLLLMQVSAVYIASHASIYYITQYKLIPVIINRAKLWLFGASFLLLALLLSLVMYGLIRLILGDEMLHYFGNSMWISGLSFFMSNLFMGSLMVGIKTILDKIRNQRLNQQKEKEGLYSELSYLKAQVNPHFLFNTINSVYVLIKLNPDKAAEMLIKLSDLLRSQLYDFSDERVSIEQELGYLDNYIELEKLRRAHRVVVKFEKCGDLNGFSLPPLLLIPFLENCFKHLSTNTDKDNRVSLKIARIGQKLHASFENTFDQQTKPYEPGGIGLSNVKRRLDLLFPKRYQLENKVEGDLYLVKLILTLT